MRNFEYYELSLANKTKPKMGVYQSRSLENKKVWKYKYYYESTSALNFLSWCIKEFTF